MEKTKLTYDELLAKVQKLEKELEEQKKAQKSALSDFKGLKSIAERLIEGVQIIDFEWKYFYLNESSIKQSRLKKEDLIGKKFQEVWKGIESTELYQKIKSCLEDKISSSFENEFKYNDGTSGWFILSIQPVEFGAFILSVDVSRIKNSELKLISIADENRNLFNNLTAQNFTLNETQQKLLESELQFRLIIENAPFGIFIQIDRRFAYINRKGLELWGVEKAEDIINRPVIETIHPAFQQFVINRMKELNDDKKSQPVGEISIIKLDGSIAEVETHGVPFTYESKNGALVFVRDVTEKKQAEKKLRLLSHSVQQSSVSILITDSEGKIEYVNPSFTEKSGYEFEEIKGKKPNFLKSNYHSKIFYDELWATIIQGKVWNGEIMNKKKNGELFWEKVIISPLCENGVITHFVAVKEDITDKKKILEDLIIAKQKAEEMNRVKSYFFANMSHELRTPFVGIMGFSELLYESLDDPELKEMAENILISSTRMQNTLSKILSLSRHESDEVSLSPVNFNIKSFVESICADYFKEINKKNLEFAIENYLESAEIFSDKTVIEEILRNLINNAVIYTDRGRIDVILKESMIEGVKSLIIEVRDTGIGIAADKLDVIWQEFRQASEGISRSFEGTGIGLTITQKDVNLLRGKIHVVSEEGKGSEFRVELPLNRFINLNEEKDKSSVSLVNNPKDAKKKILHIEDDQITRLVMKKAFSKKYDIDFASNAEISLQKLEKERYDLILMDINLGPGIDGKELSAIIRKMPDYKSIPIIAVTAYSNKKDKDDFHKYGITHYMLKPFMMNDMRELIEEIFQG